MMHLGLVPGSMDTKDPKYCLAVTVAFIRIQILALLILAQVWLSTSQFVFELEVDLDSVTAGNFNCNIGLFDGDLQCRIYFQYFAWEEILSLPTMKINCPLQAETLWEWMHTTRITQMAVHKG